VYPKVFNYFSEHKLSFAGKTFEIYRILAEQKMETTYLFPIEQHL